MASNAEKCEINSIDASEKFKEIVLSNGITEPVSEVIIKDAGLTGEGFASLSQFATVKFENPSVSPLNLFVKVYTSSDSHTELLKEMKAFEKESMFLFHYVPAAKEMCTLKGREGFIDFYPKCYFGDSKMIVLQNLVLDKGYETIDMEVRQDLEAAKLAIKTLARHHAITHVMMEENGGANEFFEKYPNLDYDCSESSILLNLMESVFDNSINTQADILEKSGIKGADVAANKLRSFLGKPMEILRNSMKKPRNKMFLTLCHGDYWNNNMMFLKDKETNKYTHHLAIDFQTISYGSAASDLAYYFYTSVQWKVRRSHLRDLLELYMETLNDITKDFGHPKNLSFEDLFLEFRREFPLGFWSGFTMAVGPGLAVFKGVDISEFDIKDWADVSNRLLFKWIEENPNKVEQIVEEVIQLLEEYESFVIKDTTHSA